MAKAPSAVQQELLDAILAEDAKAAKAAIQKMTVGDPDTGMPALLYDAATLGVAFQSLPAETREKVAASIRSHPEVLPNDPKIRGAVDKALAGVPSTQMRAVSPSPIPPRDIPNVRPGAGVPPAYSGQPKSGLTVAANAPPSIPYASGGSIPLTRATGAKQGTIAGYVQGTTAPSPGKLDIPKSANISRVDEKLLDILSETVARTGQYARVTPAGGANDRKSSSSRHMFGQAIDIQLFDATGKAIPNYQNGPAFAAYELFAQAARAVQMEKYPDLGNQFRWGGYFSGGRDVYGALDLMHFDLKPGAPMAGGNWRTGLTQLQRANFPSAVSLGAAGFARTGFAFAPLAGLSPAQAAAAKVAAGETPAPAKGKPVPPNPTERPNLIGVQAVISEGGRIKKGEEREAVKEVQKFLNAHGITDNKGQPLKEDGKAGIRTTQAIRNYQETHPELKVDGNIGPRTLVAMIRDENIRTAPEDRATRAAGMPGQTGTTAYPGGVPAAASAVTNYAMERGAALSAWLAGPPLSPYAMAEGPALYDLRRSGSDAEFTGETGGRNAISDAWQVATTGSPYGNQMASGSPALGSDAWEALSRSSGYGEFGSTGGTGMADPWDRMPGDNPLDEVAMSFDNAIFVPHDGPVDEYRMGGSRLGTYSSAAETDSIYGASSAAARAFRDREEVAAMRGRVSDAFAPAAFSAALAWFAQPTPDETSSPSGAWDSRSPVYDDTPSGNSGDWTSVSPSYDDTPAQQSGGDTPSGNTGGWTSVSPSYDDTPAYNYSDSIDFGGGIGHA